MSEWLESTLALLKDLGLGIYLTFFTGRWIQWLDSRAQAQRAIGRIRKRVGETSTDLPLKAWPHLSLSLVDELRDVADTLSWRGHRAAAEQLMEVANGISNQVLSFCSAESRRLLNVRDDATVDEITDQIAVANESVDAAVSVRWEVANWLATNQSRLEQSIMGLRPNFFVILLLPRAEQIETGIARFRRYLFDTGEWR